MFTRSEVHLTVSEVASLLAVKFGYRRVKLPLCGSEVYLTVSEVCDCRRKLRINKKIKSLGYFNDFFMIFTTQLRYILINNRTQMRMIYYLIFINILRLSVANFTAAKRQLHSAIAELHYLYLLFLSLTCNEIANFTYRKVNFTVAERQLHSAIAELHYLLFLSLTCNDNCKLHLPQGKLHCRKAATSLLRSKNFTS